MISMLNTYVCGGEFKHWCVKQTIKALFPSWNWLRIKYICLEVTENLTSSAGDQAWLLQLSISIATDNS